MNSLTKESLAEYLRDLQAANAELSDLIARSKIEFEVNERLICALQAKIGPEPTCAASEAAAQSLVPPSRQLPTGTDEELIEAVKVVVSGMNGESFSPIQLFQDVSEKFGAAKFEKKDFYPLVRKMGVVGAIEQVQKGSGKRPALYKKADASSFERAMERLSKTAE